MARNPRPAESVHIDWAELDDLLADPTKGEGTAEEEPLAAVVVLPAGESVLLAAPPSSSSLPKIGTLMLNFWQTSWKRVVKTKSIK
jgi:hypothetical protein